MYTYLEGSSIDVKEDITHISDVSSFCEDILLGCQDVVTVLVEDKSDPNSLMLESVGCTIITVSDLTCCGEIIDTAITDAYDELKTFSEAKCEEFIESYSNDVSLEFTEDVYEPEIQSDTGAGLITDDSIVEVDSRGNLDCKPVDNLIEPVVNVEVISEPKKKKSKLSGLLSKISIFRRSSDEMIEVDVSSNFARSISNSKLDLNNINTFKSWLLSEGYMNEDSLNVVESEISARKGRGLSVKFLQVARELKLLNDVDCASILTKAHKREVQSYIDIDMDLVNTLTAFNKFLRKDCFLLKHDVENRLVMIGHDIGSYCDLGEVEVYFPGYKIICKEFVEGTTSRVVCDIKI